MLTYISSLNCHAKLFMNYAMTYQMLIETWRDVKFFLNVSHPSTYTESAHIAQFIGAWRRSRWSLILKIFSRKIHWCFCMDIILTNSLKWNCWCNIWKHQRIKHNFQLNFECFSINSCHNMQWIKMWSHEMFN